MEPADELVEGSVEVKVECLDDGRVALEIMDEDGGLVTVEIDNGALIEALVDSSIESIEQQESRHLRELARLRDDSYYYGD